MLNGNYPVLSQDRLDYVNGTYVTAIARLPQGNGMAVRHTVDGSNLVVGLLERGEAAFATEVSSPYATYRRIHIAEPRRETTLTQEVTWETEKIVPPVYVRPLVISVLDKPISVRLNGQHGVHDLWHDVEVSVAPGTILAQDQFWRTSSTMESLIRLASNDELSEGAYRVEMNTGEGLHFIVQMHPKLFSWMVNPDKTRHRDSILTGCLSRAFELIHAEFGNTDHWREFPVLRALHKQLEEDGLATWENGDAFNPDEVASCLRPLNFTANSDD
jgi:hypothetical protein